MTRPHPIVFAFGGATLALSVGFLSHPALGWTIILFGILGALAWTDARTETVPDGLTLGLAATGLVHTALTGGALIPFLVLAGILIALGLIQDRFFDDGGWFGSGDYFLFAGAAAWLGPFLLIDLILLTTVALILHAIIVRRTTLALAPSLAVAIALLWLGGPIL